MVFLPLFDRNPIRYIQSAHVTLAILFLCLCVFFYQVTLSKEAEYIFILMYGATPSSIFNGTPLSQYESLIPAGFTILTSMFLHGDFMHLAGNMLFLWVLGDNIEDELGHLRFLLFYVVCGIAGAVAHSLVDITSEIPMIGASGAISGIIGAYLILHPKAPIKTLIWFFVIEVPAWLLLGMWTCIQFSNIFFSGSSGIAEVAWWAHVGGFITGVILIILFRKKNLKLFDEAMTGVPRYGPRISLNLSASRLKSKKNPLK